MNMKFKSNFSAVAIVALLGVVLSTAVFMEIRSSARERFSDVFHKLSQDRTAAVSKKLEYHLLEMDGLRRFYEQSEEVTGKEFKGNAEPMLRDSCVQTIEWITDIMMLDTDGLEVVLSMRENHPDIPVIAISGGMTRSLLDFLPVVKKIGAIKVFYKPVELEDLFEGVRELIGGGKG